MADEQALEIVRSALKGSPVREPRAGDRVYKDECMFSFDTAFSPGGLYLNLKTWQSFGEQFVELDRARTGNRIYLHEKAHKVPKDEPNGQANTDRPDRLAIGGSSGFQVGGDKFTVSKSQWLVCFPENLRIALPKPELPMLILNTLAAIAAHDSASLQDETSTWQEECKESIYANDLPQLETGMGQWGRSIPKSPDDWECDETGEKDNLWLNLSTGFIGSGRQNWDGSGGNGAAVRHFEATGKRYPLAVKLGTITPHGADVFSYAEDDMVTDPKLPEHLAHWGINMMGMQKTAKTMTELQIDLNMSYEFDKITESGSALQPLSGPGYVGLQNLGNSCYMNSVLQMLYMLPSVRETYAKTADHIFQAAPEDPGSDFSSQMAKLGVALTTARTGDADSSSLQNGLGPSIPEHDSKPAGQSVRPLAFKTLVGKGHSEFSSGRQQDASEYFQYLLDTMTKAERISGHRSSTPSTASAFEFGIETRVQCLESGRVSYKQDAATNILSINIPVEAADNLEEVDLYKEREAKRARLIENNAEAYITQDMPSTGNGFISNAAKEEKVLPRVPLSACLQQWQEAEEVNDYFSAALNRKARALKQMRLASFPPFLVLQLNRFYLADDWTAKKLEVLVDIPDKLQLEHLRATGLQPGEQEQPEVPQKSAQAETSTAIQPDPAIVEALVQMGFTENGSKRAAVATQNGGPEASMEWILSHMDDADLNDPIPEPSAASDPEAYSANPESVSMLSSMGFTDRQATAALKACQGSLERAADWLFSHSADLETSVNEVLQPNLNAATASKEGAVDGVQSTIQDGKGNYRLAGFISHMGANTACGHYVCHLCKGGQWVIFNDEKVAVSENPPKELGYLYLFQREDTL